MPTISLNPRRGQVLAWAGVADGTRLVGRFTGMREGKYGPLADLDTADGPVPVPTILMRQLTQVIVGASITIVHRGLKPSRTGDKSYRDFEVLIESADRLPSSATALRKV